MAVPLSGTARGRQTRGVHLRTFVVEASCAAAPERVFALLEDAPAWQRWAGPLVPRARWESGGTGTVGAVRRLGAGPLSVREQVVRHETPTEFSYALLTARRWHGYRADVRLRDDGRGGTTITWSGSLDCPVPGVAHLLGPLFRLLVKDFARRLAYAAR